MSSRNVRIHGMYYQRKPAGKPSMPFDLQLRPHGIGDHTPYHRGVDPAFLKSFSAGDDPGPSSAPPFPSPSVQEKPGPAAQSFQCPAHFSRPVLIHHDPLVPDN